MPWAKVGEFEPSNVGEEGAPEGGRGDCGVDTGQQEVLEQSAVGLLVGDVRQRGIDDVHDCLWRQVPA